jgi:hypothetical protein
LNIDVNLLNNLNNIEQAILNDPNFKNQIIAQIALSSQTGANNVFTGNNTFTGNLQTFQNNIVVNGTVNGFDVDQQFNNLNSSITNLQTQTSTILNGQETFNGLKTFSNGVQSNQGLAVNQSLKSGDVFNALDTNLNNYLYYNNQSTLGVKSSTGTSKWSIDPSGNAVLSDVAITSYPSVKQQLNTNGSNISSLFTILNGYQMDAVSKNIVTNGLTSSSITNSGAITSTGNITSNGKVTASDLTTTGTNPITSLNTTLFNQSQTNTGLQAINTAYNMDAVNKNITANNVTTNSIANSGTITSTGNITSNGKVTGNDLGTSTTSSLNTFVYNQLQTNVSLQSQVTANLNAAKAAGALFVSGNTTLVTNLYSGTLIQMDGYNNYLSSYTITLPSDMVSRRGMHLIFTNYANQPVQILDATNNISFIAAGTMILQSDGVGIEIIYDSCFASGIICNGGTIVNKNLTMVGDGTNAYIKPTNANSTLYLGNGNKNTAYIDTYGFHFCNQAGNQVAVVDNLGHITLPTPSSIPQPSLTQLGGQIGMSFGASTGGLLSQSLVLNKVGTYMVLAQLNSVSLGTPNGQPFYIQLYTDDTTSSSDPVYRNGFEWNGGGVNNLQVNGIYNFTLIGAYNNTIKLISNVGVQSHQGGFITAIRIA